MKSTAIHHLWTTAQELGRGLLHLLYPNVCVLCQAPLQPEHPPFCDRCRGEVTGDSLSTCPRCAATVGPYIHLDVGCMSCRETPFHFDRAVRLGRHDGLLRNAILRMKFAQDAGLAELMGELWAKHAEAALRELKAEVIVPVPLHWLRRLSRGYNQSESLAWALSARLKLPCKPGWLRRIRHTQSQTHQQQQSARRDNVRGAFHARRRAALAEKVVMLVDDVMTTGCTCDEAARALLQGGAGAVVVAVLARAGK